MQPSDWLNLSQIWSVLVWSCFSSLPANPIRGA